MSSKPIDWNQAFRRAFANKPFVIVLVLLAVTAVGMGAATQFLQVTFRKTPVALPHAEGLLPVSRTFGHWEQVSEDEPLPADIEHTLGTKQYIFRKYVDTRLVGPLKIQEMRSKPSQERERMIAEIGIRMPKAVMNLGVTYYTGMVDTVAHVPDRCYIADGYQPTEYEQRGWKVGLAEPVQVRFINFEDATGFSSRQPKNVAYFFQVNGAMECNPVAVRYRLQNLFKADVYYAKIELMTMMKDREAAAKVMIDFLTQALPPIQAYLPPMGSEATTAPAMPATQEAPGKGTGGPEAAKSDKGV